MRSAAKAGNQANSANRVIHPRGSTGGDIEAILVLSRGKPQQCSCLYTENPFQILDSTENAYEAGLFVVLRGKPLEYARIERM